ncbi:unnamed protein product, partial [Polarella glacialis]
MAWDRTLTCSSPRRGQEKGDAEMGQRAAEKTNKTLTRLHGLYVSKNVGYSKSYADGYEKVFGKKK